MFGIKEWGVSLKSECFNGFIQCGPFFYKVLSNLYDGQNAESGGRRNFVDPLHEISG